MGNLQITYPAKNENAALGTLERTWSADDANEVKEVVNALAQILSNLQTSGAKYYSQEVTEADNVSIEHGLGRTPDVKLTDSAGSLCYAPVTAPDENNITITFNPPFTGKIELT